MDQPSSFQTNDLCGTELHALTCRGHVLIARVLKLSNEIPPCFRYDYILQEHKVASVAEDEKKSALSSMWKKMTSKKATVKKVLRRQADSYAQSSEQLQSMASLPSAHDKAAHSEERYKSILVDFAYLADPEKYDSHRHILQEEDTDETKRKRITEQEHLEREFIGKFETTLLHFNGLFSDVLGYYLDILQFANKLNDNHYVQYSVELLLRHGEGRQLLCELLYLYGSLLVLVDVYIPVSNN